MKKIKKKELLDSKYQGLKMKDLRRFVENNLDITDETPVLCQRIEDYYFDEGSWSVYLVEGEWWYSMERLNKNMDKEIVRRKNGEEEQYPKIKNPLKHKVKMNDSLKEQFFQSWCITKENDNSTVLIYNHY